MSQLNEEMVVNLLLGAPNLERKARMWNNNSIKYTVELRTSNILSTTLIFKSTILTPEIYPTDKSYSAK